MERHLENVDRRIENLRASRDLYAGLIARAKMLDPAECTDPDRCQTISTASERATIEAPNPSLVAGVVTTSATTHNRSSRRTR